ncbi:MAG: phosphoadenosine phosphosulfate reductase family protein [Chloroflexota bacterium]|nr:phosphoadenosine phosphosulfate reductase family protein [Chloroflexota bacterium]
MKDGPTLTVVSLGGGVQSTVMALMASTGAFDRVPDCAIFDDTHWEPPSVYEHIEWLEGQLSFPVYVVDNGRSLREDVKALTNHSGSNNYVDIPVYLKGRDEESDGIGRRQCTTNYKVRPIRRKIRELLGLRKGQRVTSGTTVELWLGISTDEAVRMKDSREKWMRNRYPLIETGMSQQDCIDWWNIRYARPLERSVCVACPFQSRQRWVETKRWWPEPFAEAVEIDAKMREGLAFAKEPHLYSLRMPLDEAVALDETKLGGDGQADGLGNECEGHCGV